MQIKVFSQSLHYDGKESYLYLNKREIEKILAQDDVRWYKFCLEGVSKDITKDELNEISLNDTVYDFSVGHSSIRKEDT